MDFRLGFLFFIAIAAVGVEAAPVRPTIVHVIADDLGYNDLGFTNGGKTHTPIIDALVADGISMETYHTYKVCSPSRASIMTGRYPWGVGYYEMKGPEAGPLTYRMLPDVLRSQGGPSDFCRFHRYSVDAHACGVLCDAATGE